MVASRIKITDQEVDNLLAMLKASGQSDVEYHLSHILVAIPEAASPEEIKKLQEELKSVQKAKGQLRPGARRGSSGGAKPKAKKKCPPGDPLCVDF